MTTKRRAAIFFDLQGTLGGEPLGDVFGFYFYPNSMRALALAHEASFLTLIVTNQSHISKGLFTMEQFRAEMVKICAEIKAGGGAIEDVYCCPHLRAEGCICKKPSPYLINLAADQYDIALDESYVVGDIGHSDMLMARNIGAKGVLVRTGQGEISLTTWRDRWADYTPDFIASDALDAVNWIIQDRESRRKDRSSL